MGTRGTANIEAAPPAEIPAATTNADVAANEAAPTPASGKPANTPAGRELTSTVPPF